MLLVVMFVISFAMDAQTWKATVYRIDGKPREKIVKLIPEKSIEIGRLLIDNDTLKENKYLYGYFRGVIGDTLQMNLERIRVKSIYTNGTRIDSHIPAKSLIAPGPDSTYVMNISLDEIDYLAYRNRSVAWLSDTEDYILFSSLIILIVSPFICYDYKNQTFNTERYKYWGLGSTLGIVTGFSLQILGGASQKKFQFQGSWPNEKAKAWSFDKERGQTP